MISNSDSNVIRVYPFYSNFGLIELPDNILIDISAFNGFFSENDDLLEKYDAIFIKIRTKSDLKESELQISTYNIQTLIGTLVDLYDYSLDRSRGLTKQNLSLDGKFIESQLFLVKQESHEVKFADIREMDFNNPITYLQIYEVVKEMMSKTDLVGILMYETNLSYYDKKKLEPKLSNVVSDFISDITKILGIKNYEISLIIEAEDESKADLYISFKN